MERNPLIMSKSKMTDLPPEVLEIILSDTDLTTKKEFRLVCKSWKQIIDSSRVVDFCIRNMRTLAQLNTFMDSPVKEFSFVKMEFTWGVKFPKYLLKDGFIFNSHTIKELVFAKSFYNKMNTSGDSHVLKFFIDFLKSGCHGVEHLNIHSEIMTNFILSDLELALSSSVQWKTVRKLSLAVSPLKTNRSELCFAPLNAFLKFVNIPNLNSVTFEVELGRFKVQGSRFSTRNANGAKNLGYTHPPVLIALVVDICKFFLRYKQTLRHVFFKFYESHQTLDLEKYLGFLEKEGPLQLESFVLEVGSAKSDALGYFAAACTEGLTKLRTFGYSNKHKLQLSIANERLERILSQNGSTIEDLTLDMDAVNYNLFRHCPNLKSLKFGDVRQMIFLEWSSEFPNITRLRVQNEYCLKPEFLNWVLENCPNLTFLEIGEHWKTCDYFLNNQISFLKFDKLKEILLFGFPNNFTRVEVQSQPEFECVRKIHPSTSVLYLSILVKNHNL